MRCPRCNGYVASETIYAQGYWIDQHRCINCGDIKHIRPLFTPYPERKTGRGVDAHKRQGYGTSDIILKLAPEEWDLVSNKHLAERFGVSSTWISQLRHKVGKGKRYRKRDSRGLGAS